MKKYICECDKHTFEFDTQREALEFGRFMTDKWGSECVVYPKEPEVKQPVCPNSMCERCGERIAEPGDFICMECISRMLIDMESEETDKY